MRPGNLAVAAIVLGAFLGTNHLCAQSKSIDVNKSSLTVHVFKSGAFSAFGHDHEIKAPIEEGEIDSSDHPSVQLRVDSRKLRVLDPETAADKRAEIQHTMEGDRVLDVGKFPEISYQSSAVTNRGEAHWEVEGELTLHGKKHSVRVETALRDGHYRGTASVKQSDFGIEPIRIAGGTVKVKDEVKIEFDVVPAQ